MDGGGRAQRQVVPGKGQSQSTSVTFDELNTHALLGDVERAADRRVTQRELVANLDDGLAVRQTGKHLELGEGELQSLVCLYSEE
jgi:hypothetical protein